MDVDNFLLLTSLCRPTTVTSIIFLPRRRDSVVVHGLLRIRYRFDRICMRQSETSVTVIALPCSAQHSASCVIARMQSSLLGLEQERERVLPINLIWFRFFSDSNDFCCRCKFGAKKLPGFSTQDAIESFHTHLANRIWIIVPSAYLDHFELYRLRTFELAESRYKQSMCVREQLCPSRCFKSLSQSCYMFSFILNFCFLFFQSSPTPVTVPSLIPFPLPLPPLLYNLNHILQIWRNKIGSDWILTVEQLLGTL